MSKFQTQICNSFQFSLSCLVDGELDDKAANAAMAHMEYCDQCQGFFEDARRQLQLHRDISNPHNLMEQFSLLTGHPESEALESRELVHRLATILYQIGKAYVLMELQPDSHMSIFEDAVKVEEARTRGRGFVDGVLESGALDGDNSAAADWNGVDWNAARGLFNGRLSRIEGALQKGVRLLEEALTADPDHEEARLYFGFVQQQKGKPLRAQREFRRVFETALDEANRGHAAVQLGLMLDGEGEYREAIAHMRWVTMSGLADFDDRFFYVRFNIGMYYAYLGQLDRSLDSFRELLDRHPGRLADIAGLFEKSPKLRLLIESKAGFANMLVSRCPELFGGQQLEDDSSGERS